MPSAQPSRDALLAARRASLGVSTAKLPDPARPGISQPGTLRDELAADALYLAIPARERERFRRDDIVLACRALCVTHVVDHLGGDPALVELATVARRHPTEVRRVVAHAAQEGRP